MKLEFTTQKNLADKRLLETRRLKIACYRASLLEIDMTPRNWDMSSRTTVRLDIDPEIEPQIKQLCEQFNVSAPVLIRAFTLDMVNHPHIYHLEQEVKRYAESL